MVDHVNQQDGLGEQYDFALRTNVCTEPASIMCLQWLIGVIIFCGKSRPTYVNHIFQVDVKIVPAHGYQWTSIHLHGSASERDEIQTQIVEDRPDLSEFFRRPDETGNPDHIATCLGVPVVSGAGEEGALGLWLERKAQSRAAALLRCG